MLGVFLRLATDTLLVALTLFGPAQTLAWPRAWALLILLFVVRAIGAVAVYRVHPMLMRERARLPLHTAQRWPDRMLLLAVLATGFLGLPLVSALDVFHWRVLPGPPPILSVSGLALFCLGWTLKTLALRANAFAVSVVRLQSERAHGVVDSGPYAVVRHPFYAADPLILVGLSLWLGSSLAVLCSVIPIALMLTRLRGEERFLCQNLPGYSAYTERVRFKLLPGVW